ncbi:MAG: hypothetical protein A2Y86_06035 [Candidatus Aminicenantes bacterium RBG_13_62_12]|nr:MAG: hypothetical protein A2Y86_06035 [Candidatus Aminicenantes bacterium RBG_13_62_12]
MPYIHGRVLRKWTPGPGKTGAPADSHRAETPATDPARLERRIEKLAEFGKTPEGGVNRTAFGDDDVRSRTYLLSLLEEAGLQTRIDACGNILGRRE